MSIDKNKEELKERLLKAHALSDDELEKVSGGFTVFPKCEFCGCFHSKDEPCPKNPFQTEHLNAECVIIGSIPNSV